MALSTADRTIVRDAADHESFRDAILDLAGDIALLRADVRTLMWVMVPIACTALVLAAAAFIVAVVR